MTSRWAIFSLRKFCGRLPWASRPLIIRPSTFSRFPRTIPAVSTSARFNPVGIALAGIATALKELYHGEPVVSNEEEKVREMMKKAKEALNQQRLSEAEKLLEEALTLASDINNIKAVNHLMELLASVFFESKQYAKAEKLLTQLIGMLIEQKYEATGPPIVELSIKLAEAYWKLGDLEKAEDGFKFCINSQRQNVTKVMDKYSRKPGKTFVTLQDNYQEENQSLALYGMVAESYSRFLMLQNKFKAAEFYFSESLQIAFRVYGPSHKHTVAMQNNFGCLCLKQKQFETAAYFLEQATVKALYNPECAENLPAYYSNYSEALYQVGKYEESLEKARKAVSFAQNVQDTTVLKKAERFLSLIEVDVKKQQKSKKT